MTERWQRARHGPGTSGGAGRRLAGASSRCPRARRERWGARVLVPAPWREAFGQAKPFRIGTLQPLSGTRGRRRQDGAGRRADGGGPDQQDAAGSTGRPLELVIADYESKPDVGRRKAEKLVVDDKIDAHAGGYLSNVCLACMPVYEEHKVVNMITVCLDTTITTTKCSRYTFRPFDYAPAQAVAVGAVPGRTRWARSGTSPMPTTRGASPHATPTSQQIKKRGRRRSSRRPASRSAPPT